MFICTETGYGGIALPFAVAPFAVVSPEKENKSNKL